MDRGDQRVRIARHHCEGVALRCRLPEPRDTEDRLIWHGKPHLAFAGLLAVAQVKGLRRPFAKLGERDDAPVFRQGGELLPLRQVEVTDVRHRPGRLSAKHVPRHDVDTPAEIILPHHIGAAARRQLDRVEAIIHRPRREPVSTELFAQGLRLEPASGSVTHAGSGALGERAFLRPGRDVTLALRVLGHGQRCGGRALDELPFGVSAIRGDRGSGEEGGGGQGNDQLHGISPESRAHDGTMGTSCKQAGFAALRSSVCYRSESGCGA